MINLPAINPIKRITMTPGMKLIVLSDMHKGDGSGADDFVQNSLIYCCALEYYLKNGFTCIELGDAEELWESDNFDQIYITHTETYDLLAKFHDPDPEKTRYIKVWGNHDLYWKDHQSIYQAFFPEIQIYEGVLLNDTVLMIHGHQADSVCNGIAALISRFFVDHLWGNLQRGGAKDATTRVATNPGLSNAVDKRLHHWATNPSTTNTLKGTRAGGAASSGRGINTIIAGHTHRAVFENLSLTEMRLQAFKHKVANATKRSHGRDPCYYNTGCCVYPQGITGLEITMTGKINYQLVGWFYAADGGTVSVRRAEL